MRMVLGKFRGHPVLDGNEVFDKNGTGQISRASEDWWKKFFIEVGTGKTKFRERPVFLAN
jgi:hypothetical protein